MRGDSRHEDKYCWVGNHGVQTSSVGAKVKGPKLQTMIENGKKDPLSAVFAKIIFYNTVSFKKFFKITFKKCR